LGVIKGVTSEHYKGTTLRTVVVEEIIGIGPRARELRAVEVLLRRGAAFYKSESKIYDIICCCEPVRIIITVGEETLRDCS